jgi:hypothetical protein
MHGLLKNNTGVGSKHITRNVSDSMYKSFLLWLGIKAEERQTVKTNPFRLIYADDYVCTILLRVMDPIIRRKAAESKEEESRREFWE